jgi:hypothetical protein
MSPCYPRTTNPVCLLLLLVVGACGGEPNAPAGALDLRIETAPRTETVDAVQREITLRFTWRGEPVANAVVFTGYTPNSSVSPGSLLHTAADGRIQFTWVVPKPHETARVLACATADGAVCNLEELYAEPASP